MFVTSDRGCGRVLEQQKRPPGRVRIGSQTRGNFGANQRTAFFAALDKNPATANKTGEAYIFRPLTKRVTH